MSFNKTLNKQKRSFHLDKMLLFLLISLAVVSVITIYLAQPIVASYLRSQNLYLKQAFWYFLSFGMLFVLLQMGIDRLFTTSRIIYWILMALLIILLVDKYLIDLPDMFITPVNGTTAWIFIPGIGSLQPSEFMKVILIIEVGHIIYKHNMEKETLSFDSDIHLFLKVFKVILPPIILILLQPDSGVPLIMLFSIAIMLAVGGIRKEWIIIGVVSVGLVFFVIIYLFFNNPQLLGTILGDNYRLTRFYGWLAYEDYILSYGNQLYTSLLTLGSSGLTGHELNQVYISFPEPQTDFIFTVYAQNFGFLGSAFLLTLITFLDLRIIYIAHQFEYRPEKIIASGLVGMLMFQQIQNIAMTIGVLPITGITLPFISYGGSSMLSYFIPLAIIFYMYSETKSKTEH